MRRVLALSLPVMGVLILTLAGCSSEDVASDGDVLISLTDEVVVPAYESLAQDMAQLNRDVNALCDAPSDSSLEAAPAVLAKCQSLLGKVGSNVVRAGYGQALRQAGGLVAYKR